MLQKYRLLSLSAAVEAPEVGKGLGLRDPREMTMWLMAHWIILHGHLLHLDLRAVGALVDFLAGMGCDSQAWGLQIFKDLFGFVGKNGIRGQGWSLCTH